jgi:hypothetical protein
MFSRRAITTETASRARKPNLYHSNACGVAADFLTEVQDPVRDNRPIYQPADPLIRFHYAVTRRHQARLRRHGAAIGALWADLIPAFRAQVLGPCFEAMARARAMDFASTGRSVEHLFTLAPPPWLFQEPCDRCNRATSARLLLFGQHFDASVLRAAEARDDLEIIALRRLLKGSSMRCGTQHSSAPRARVPAFRFPPPGAATRGSGR